MTDQPPNIVTEPHNPFLRDTFQAFMAEGLPIPVATAMVSAHIAHAGAKADMDQARTLDAINGKLGRFGSLDKITYELGRIADSLATLSALASDPVELGRVLALVRAGDAKRAEKSSE